MTLKNVRAEMGRNHMTVGELAEKLGVTYGTVHNWLNGHTKIPATEIKKMAEIFGVTTDYLLEVSRNKNERK